MPDYVSKVNSMLARAGFDASRLAGKTQEQATTLLLEAAEQATSTAEAQSCLAIASRWMAEKSITAAMLAAAQPDTSPRTAADGTVGPMGRPFQHQRKDLAVTIGCALHLHPVINRLPSSAPGKYREDITVTLVGAKADLDRARTLFTSTMLQALNVMAHEVPRDAGSSQKQSWLQGWAAGVGHVLDLSEANARQSYDQEHALEAGHKGTALVLADWDVILLAHRARLYPNLRTATARTTSGNLFRTGFNAGTRANLDVARPAAGALARLASSSGWPCTVGGAGPHRMPELDTTEKEAEMPDLHTAGELADYLAAMPRDTKIVLSKDAEGNGHSPLATADPAMYEPESTWAGSIYPTPEDLAAVIGSPDNPGFTAEDAAPDGAERVIVLWPTN